MAEPTPQSAGRMFVWAGVSDIVVGAGLAFAGLTDLFGPGLELLALGGGVMALVGVGFIVLGRHKLSQAESRRGDMN